MKKIIGYLFIFAAFLLVGFLIKPLTMIETLALIGVVTVVGFLILIGFAFIED